MILILQGSYYPNKRIRRMQENIWAQKKRTGWSSESIIILTVLHTRERQDIPPGGVM